MININFSLTLSNIVEMCLQIQFFCLPLRLLCFDSRKYVRIAVQILYVIDVYYGLFGIENELCFVYTDTKNICITLWSMRENVCDTFY